MLIMHQTILFIDGSSFKEANLVQSRTCDVLIIGAGPAGLTAAVYTAWLGLKTVVLESGVAGGKAWTAPMIENFPGFDVGIKGSDLAERMQRQAARLGAEIFTSEEVVGLNLDGDKKQVSTRKQLCYATAVILATGTQKRKLHVSGEAEFLGRGVSYCAICDGPFFRSSKVAVVGNSNETAVEALSLSEIAEHVLLVHEGDLKIEGTILGRLKDKPAIETGDGEVEQAVKGVFIALGSVPLTAIVRNAGIALDANGCIMVDRQQRTNVAGVFAAGDCTCGGMQVVTAAGEGAVAAMRASRYVRSKDS
jgi:thioredoxin reductase (NADPH)